MRDIEVGDLVLISVKRNELVAKVVRIEKDIATCSFYMPRSKGMCVMKFPINNLKEVKVNNSSSEHLIDL